MKADRCHMYVSFRTNFFNLKKPIVVEKEDLTKNNLPKLLLPIDTY